MAFKTVANLRDSVQAILTGISLNNVQNLNGAFERTAREIKSRIYVPEAGTYTNLTLYDGVYTYTAPTDIFGSSLVDFRPQGITRTTIDYVQKQPIAIFDRTKAILENGYQLTFEYVQGIGRVRVASMRPMPRLVLDTMSATTGWTLAGSASGLTQDSTVFWDNPSSLRFLLTGASTGTLTKTISSQDFTNYVGVGVVFLAIRTPSATNLTSISIKLGSSASNYYQVSSVTTGFLGAWVANEWLLVALDLATATTTGTPTVTAITYCQVSIAHAATLTNFYVGGLWISLPSPHTLMYQTDSIFQASGSTPSASITTTADTVNLNDSAYLIYEYECANTIAQQQGGGLASGLIAMIESKLNGKRARNGAIVELGLYDIYRGANPSQELRTVGQYYGN